MVFHPSTLRRAVLNVLQNAIEAMTEALAEELGLRPLQARCHRGLGTRYATFRQREQARVELSTAVEMYRGMEMTFWLSEAEAALAQVHEG